MQAVITQYILLAMVCSEQKVTSQCTIKHYMSATNVQPKFVWSLQILEKTIYREEEQDNSATEPFADMDLRQYNNIF